MKERGRKGLAGVVRFGRASGEEQGRLDAFGTSFFRRQFARRWESCVGCSCVVGGGVFVVSRLRERKNWEWADEAADNERRMMLSRPPPVPSARAPQAPSGVGRAFNPRLCFSAHFRPRKSTFQVVHSSCIACLLVFRMYCGAPHLRQAQQLQGCNSKEFSVYGYNVNRVAMSVGNRPA